MNFIKQIERIKKMHNLITSEKTGTPSVFQRNYASAEVSCIMR